jgi:hypothetical protein
MIVDSPAAFRDAMARGGFTPRQRATPRAALLVSPIGFRLAEDSAADNRYMQLDESVSEERALAEHARLAAALAATLPVLTLPGDAETPDAVFPNNVFATVPGKLIVGTMRHPTRQLEGARADIFSLFTGLFAYRVEKIPPDAIAELTGPLVIDYPKGQTAGGILDFWQRPITDLIAFPAADVLRRDLPAYFESGQGLTLGKLAEMTARNAGQLLEFFGVDIEHDTANRAFAADPVGQQVHEQRLLFPSSLPILAILKALTNDQH